MSMPEKDTPIIIPNTSSILVMCLNFFRTIHGETNKHVHERTIFSTFLKHFLDFSTGFHTISRKHKISGSPRYVVATLAQTSLLKNISTPEPLWRSVLVKRKVPHKMWLPQKGSQYGNGPRFFCWTPRNQQVWQFKIWCSQQNFREAVVHSSHHAASQVRSAEDLGSPCRSNSLPRLTTMNEQNFLM